MTVDTHIQQALDRVQGEQDAVEGKQAAYKRFVSGVEGISTDPPTTQQGGDSPRKRPVRNGL